MGTGQFFNIEPNTTNQMSNPPQPYMYRSYSHPAQPTTVHTNNEHYYSSGETFYGLHFLAYSNEHIRIKEKILELPTCTLCQY